MPGAVASIQVMSKWLGHMARAAALTAAAIVLREVHRIRQRAWALANPTAKVALSPVKVPARQSSAARRGWHKARVAVSTIRLAGVRKARIALLLAGSRGDYQGYVAFCKVLLQRGLRVEAWCLGETNAEFMRSLGIAARAADVPVGDELFKRDPQICKAMETGDEMMYMKAIAALFAKHSAGIAASAINFHDAFQPDVLIFHPMMMGIAKDLHDVSGLPVVQAPLFPRTPSAHLAPLYYSRTGNDAPGRADRSAADVQADNLALHRSMFEEFFSGAFGAPHQEVSSRIKTPLAPATTAAARSTVTRALPAASAAQARKQAGLPPLTPDDMWSLWFDPAQPTICGWSTVIAPKLPDWPESVHVTGYWTMDVKDQVAKLTRSPNISTRPRLHLTAPHRGPTRSPSSSRRRSLLPSSRRAGLPSTWAGARWWPAPPSKSPASPSRRASPPLPSRPAPTPTASRPPAPLPRPHDRHWPHRPALLLPPSARQAAMGAGVRAVVLGGWAALSLDSLPAGPLRECAAATLPPSPLSAPSAPCLHRLPNSPSPRPPLRRYAAANVLFYAGSLPHEWLFPKCAAAVHHGGAGNDRASRRPSPALNPPRGRARPESARSAPPPPVERPGTVAAVLRCGIPNIVTPVFIDQFYWARRVSALRVGYGFSEPLRSLGAPALAAAIKECVTSAESAPRGALERGGAPARMTRDDLRVPRPNLTCGAVKANAKTLGKQLKEERPGAETAADVVAEVARQRMLALAAAQRTEDVRLPTPVALKRGHSLGKGPAFGPSED